MTKADYKLKKDGVVLKVSPCCSMQLQHCVRVCDSGRFSCDFLSLRAARRLYHSNMLLHNLFIWIFNMWQPWLLYLNFSTLKRKKKTHNPRPFFSRHEIQQRGQTCDLKYPSNNTQSSDKDVYNRYTVLCINKMHIYVTLPDSNGNRLDFGAYRQKLKINRMSQANCEFFSAGAATGLCRCSKLLHKFFLWAPNVWQRLLLC